MAQYGNYIFELSKKVTRKPVSYKNRYGIQIAADLYIPKDFDENKKYQAIILGGPNTTVKEQSSGFYANQLAERGFVALAFDYSFNGYSGGMPRNICSPEIFVEDVSAGVDFLGTRSFVDSEKIGALGVCASGGFILSAAQVDKRIKAIVTLSMYVGTDFSYLTDDMRNVILDDLAEQRYFDFEGDHPALGSRFAPVHFDKNSDPAIQELCDYYCTERAYHHQCLTAFTATSSLALMNFSLLDHLKWINPRPVLLIAGENAPLKVIPEAIYNQLDQPKELYIVPGATHMDLYDRLDVIPFAKIEEFFNRNL